MTVCVKLVTLFFLILHLFGCEMEYHPYDNRVEGECNINAKNIVRIELGCATKKQIKFVVIGDTQRRYNETSKVVSAINQRNDIDFVIHTGDITDFGVTNEYERQRDILNKLKVPYVCVIGNHDCLGTGYLIFRKVFGDFDFSFKAGDTFFVCLNTNAMEFDHTTTVPNFSFIADRLVNYPNEMTKTVAVMHADPYSEQADIGVASLFQEKISLFRDLQFCVHGHGHNFKIRDLFGDGVLYYQCDDISKERYLIFTIKEDGYEYELATL